MDTDYRGFEVPEVAIGGYGLGHEGRSHRLPDIIQVRGKR